MARFEPFAALRYSRSATAPDPDDDGVLLLDRVIAPPYDVLSAADVAELEARHPHNIVHVDVPGPLDDPGRYEAAGRRFRSWIASGVLVADDQPTFTRYEMKFTDASGADRDIVGVVGALEVVDDGAGGVLAHERTTPKASTDRLDLTRATAANLSPIWGLALAGGLTDLLAEPGEPVGSVHVDGVVHTVERITDVERIAAISAAVGADDVLIADGHHRYGVARTYRDERRAATGSSDGPAETTLAFVGELVPEQLSVEAIHRLYTTPDPFAIRRGLATMFDTVPVDVDPSGVLAWMERRGALVLVDGDRSMTGLVAKPGVFDDVRALDGAWLEHCLAGLAADVTYQHGVEASRDAIARGAADLAVLIRPVSVDEIRRTAREGLLMPPKSTFFTPKLRTGFVERDLQDVRQATVMSASR